MQMVRFVVHNRPCASVSDGVTTRGVVPFLSGDWTGSVEVPEVLEAWTAPTKGFYSLVAPTKESTDRSTCGPTNVSWNGTNYASEERATEPNKLVSTTAKQTNDKPLDKQNYATI